MSQWTHVAGIIRIDALDFLEPDIEQELIASFGLTCDYESTIKAWDECTAPLGSEGSVQHKIVHTGTENMLAWGLIYIWGDLRDYSNTQEIYDWIKNACKNFIIRSCSVKVDIEFQRSYIIYDDGNGNILLKELDKNG